MTLYERLHRVARPFDHPLRQRVHSVLADLEGGADRPLRLLDVGGRRSQYTIGLRSAVVVSDLPRESTLQDRLDLGATERMRQRVLRQRTNVVDYILDDMTRTQLPSASFDVVLAVEVLEHVEEDDAFVANVARVLAPGGTFVMTTPNGDFLTKLYPDHKRHYRKLQLESLLSRHFASVSVAYAVNHGPMLRVAQPHRLKRAPVRRTISPALLGLSYLLERMGAGGAGPTRKRHLVAVASAVRFNGNLVSGGGPSST